MRLRIVFQKNSVEAATMDFRQLRMFAAVAEHGSLNQAAAHLNISQPAASTQIRLLEQELGVLLFERKPHGLALTPSGASLLPKAQQLLLAANDVRVSAKRLSGRAAGRVKLAGVPAAFDASVLPLGGMLHALWTSHPELDIEVYQRSSPDVWACIEESVFDVGLMFGSRKNSCIRQIPLQILTYRVVAPGTWDAGVCQAPWKELASYPWVTCTGGGKHHNMATRLFRQFDCEPTRFVHGENEQVITSLVTSGIGLGLMREDLALAARASGKVFIVEKMRLSAPLKIAYRIARENDPAIRAIVDVLTRHRGSCAPATSAAKRTRGMSL
jgi:DNA-binding transcriptional LysR family regulator